MPKQFSDFDSENLRERRLVFVEAGGSAAASEDENIPDLETQNAADDYDKADLEVVHKKEDKEPEANISDMNPEDKTALNNLFEEFEMNLLNARAADVKFNKPEYELRKLVTLEARKGIHKIETTDQLLDAAITERLRDNIVKIARIQAKYDTNTEKGQKKIEESVKKMSKKLNSEREIQQKINDLHRGPLGLGLPLTEKTRKQRNLEIEALEDLKKERGEIEGEEARKLVFAAETSESNLENDFGYLETGAISMDPNLRLLHNLLPSSTLHNWRKDADLRMLLFHLKNPKSKYRIVLGRGKVDSVQTNLDSKTDSLKKQKVEPTKKIKEVLKNEPGIISGWSPTTGNLKKLKSVMKGIKETKDDELHEIKTKAEDLESKISELSSEITLDTDELKALEEFKITIKNFEEEIKSQGEERRILEEENKRLEEKRKEARQNLDITERTLLTTNQEIPSTIHGTSKTNPRYGELQGKKDNLKKELILIDTNIGGNQQKIIDIITAVKTAKGDKSKKEKDLKSKEIDLKSEKNTQLKPLKASLFQENRNLKKKQEEVEKVDSVFVKLEPFVQQRDSLQKQTKSPEVNAPISPKELFTKLELELAKVNVCKQQGFSNTTDLNKPENVFLLKQAEKIGRLSSQMKLENFSNEMVKKDNGALLEKIAARNPTVKQRARKVWQKFSESEWKKGESKKKTAGMLVPRGLKKLYQVADKIGASVQGLDKQK
jgi:hypothetical protein